MRRLAVVSTAALVLLTACSGSTAGSSGSSGGREAAVGRAPGAKVAPAEPVRLAPTTRAIVYTADLTVRSGDVDRAAATAKSLVAAAGGYVGTENTTRSPGVRPAATITFRIPSARYQDVLDRLGGIGTRESLRQQADDVTEEVADVTSRVASAKATLASLRKLLGRASGIDDVVRLEQEISTREADLESLQARQKSLASQTSYATVTLRLEGTAPVSRPHRSRTGFAGGLSSGWNAFTAFLGGLTLVVGWLLPFLCLAAVVALPVLWWRRRRTARRPDAPPDVSA
jgi:hypothetical protein